MSTQVQYRRGTEAQNNAFTGALAEITVDTTNWTLRVHDGATAGGTTIINAGSSQTLANKTYTGTSLSVTGNVTGSYIFGNGSQLTGIDTTSIQNGNSNVQISTSGGNVVVSVNGTPSIAAFTPTGLEINGDLSVTGNATLTGNILGDRIVNGTTEITILSANGNANISVGGTSDVAVFAPTGQYITGLLSVTGNITSGNLSGTNVTGTLTTSAQPNITSVGTLAGLTVSGNIIPSANITYDLGNATNRFNDLYLAGNSIFLGNVTISADGDNLDLNANVLTANFLAGTLTTNAQPNVTSVGTLSSLSVSGNVDAGNVSGTNITGTLLTAAQNNITSVGTLTSLSVTGNVDAGNVSGTNVTGTLTTNAQPNITSVGTLSSLSVSGNVDAGNLSGTNVTGTLTTNAQPNITSVGTLSSLSVTGNVDAGNVSGTNLTGTLLTAAQNNITSVGTLSSLSVSGTVTGGNLATAGTLSVDGTTTANAINSTGQISTTGNIIGGNIVTNALVQGNAVSATGTVTAGNIITGGTITATGNIQSNGTVTTNAISSISGALTVSTDSGDLILNAGGNIDASNNYVNNLLNPVQAHDAATKEYVDNVASTGITIHNPVRLESPTALNGTYAQGGNTYTVNQTIAGNTVVFSSAANLQPNDQLWFSNNFEGILANTPYFVVSAPNTSAAVLSLNYSGAPVTTITSNTGLTQSVRVNSGVGATLTNAGANATLQVDGVTVSNSDRILVYQQANAAHNGVYVVTEAGNATTAWQLTRSTDADTYSPNDSNGLDVGDYVYVQAGDTGAGESYVMTNPVGPFIIGYDNLTFTQFSASQVYTANTAAGLTLNGTVFSAKVDNETTAFSSGNIVVKAGANLVTPNIGDATGTSLSLTGTASVGNVSTVGTISATGNITGNYFFGNGSQLTGIDATSIQNGTSNVRVVSSGGDVTTSVGGTSNVVVVSTTGMSVTGTVSASGTTTSGNLATAGTLSVGGTTTAAAINSTGQISTTGNVVAVNVTGTLLTAAQPNITSLGNLSQANIATANITNGTAATSTATGALKVTGGAGITGNVYAGAFYGAATGLSSIPGANVTGTVANATYATSAGSATTATSATTAGTVTTAAQGNITSVGTLTSLALSGLLTGATSAATDVNTANDTGSFSARGNTTTVASMSFHRAGAYAINMGLGTDNVFRIGGWSASNNCLQLSGTGALTILSTISAGGNITGGNLITSGSGGNITGANVVSATTILTSQIQNSGSNGVGNIGNSTTYFNTVFAKATSAQYADLAEAYVADAEYPPGTVLVFGGDAEVTVSTVSGDTAVAGVVSTNPAHVMNSGLNVPNTVVLALTGRVPTRVVGPVRKGQMMVSAENGYAQACTTPAMGSVIGKALENFDGDRGVIEVVVGRL